ncbi:MAG TPA: amidase family protein [Solirubrobacteraceae bacterium]|nr:amidase family protein [Solirubrobacteraceae bacterium]
MSVSADNDLAFAGPAALAARVRAGELSPRELVEFFLARIESLDPRINAFREVRAEAALAAADRLAASEEGRSGALAGVPIAIKDDMALAGSAATYGSRSPAPVAGADAEAVAHLRTAGAIPLGVTNVPELMIFPWTATAANGVTRNPWDLSRSPGGSSGGSAAAVAAGLVPAATGSDGAGSIRIPAACCGLVGMKPSRGRVSTLPLHDPWLGLSTYGGLARTVLDSALILEVMQGGEGTSLPRESFTDAARAGAEGAGPVARPLRVGVSRRLPPGIMARLSADQRLALDRTERLLRELGHHVVERDPAYGLAALDLTQMYLRGISEDFIRLADPGRAETSTRQMARAGGWLVSQSRRAALLARRPKVSARILALWEGVDVLITPGLARTALPAEGAYGRPAPVAFNMAARFTPWTALFNLTGQPAVTLPAGFGSDGLPLSVQLVGGMGAESLLYALAAQIEAAQPWASSRPVL